MSRKPSLKDLATPSLATSASPALPRVLPPAPTPDCVCAGPGWYMATTSDAAARLAFRGRRRRAARRHGAEAAAGRDH